MKDLSLHTINSDQTIREALERLNQIPESLTLFVTGEASKMVGTLTDGDIRRNLLQNGSIGDKVSSFMQKNFKFLKEGEDNTSKIRQLRENKFNQIPLLDGENRIVRIINLNLIKTILPLDAVIMAGGRGERLRPLTDDVPKPLLKIGDKSIIDYNIDRIVNHGIRSIFITVKYLAEKIESHLGTGEDREIKINYIRETEPLGTIGSVSLIENYSNDYVLVMNSDLLTNIDLEDFYRNFQNENADMAVASVPYHVVVPYAVLEKEENNIISFREKPTFTYYSNAGIYLIKKEMLKMIPVAKHFNATDFMQELINQGKKVIQYPILGYWLDIGRHEDFTKAQEDIKHIHF